MKFQVTNPKVWNKIALKNIPMAHKLKVYEKMGGAYRLGKDGGEQVFNKMTELLKHKLKEETPASDHEVSMARGELESIADKALKLSSLLKSKSESGNPIEAWVQSKITKAADMINTVHDYMVYNPDINESVELDEVKISDIHKMQQDGKSTDEIAKELKLNSALVKRILGEEVEELNSSERGEGGFGSSGK